MHEIFGRDVGADQVLGGMSVHPFGDPRITDEFAAETAPVDARDFHLYAVEWTPEHVKTFEQSPSYPMQLVVDYVRGYRRIPG